jgi:drug/metabolite transporter (DMT)-like permease
MRADPLRPWAWPLLLIAVMFLLATVYPATKRLSAQLSPLTISLLRYGLATLALLPWYLRATRRQSVRVTAGDAGALALLGLLGVALFSFCLTAGVKMSTASSGSLLTNSQPIFTTLLAPLIIDEKFTPLRLVGALLGLAGVALIVTGGRLSAAVFRQEHFLGNLVLTGGAVALSVYTILLKRFIVRFGGLIPTFLTMLAGSLFLAAGVLATGGWRELAGLGPFAWLLAAYIGLAGTALAYPLFNAALRGYGVVRSVGYKLLIPVFGILLGYLLLAERPGLPTLLGAAVVLGAVLLIQRAAAGAAGPTGPREGRRSPVSE